ncbi:MAG: hypothetical protein HQL32_08455 [Planctomycetes bacterium]|nr:hypothetical protein [Planctomycetota bacterium]
MQIHKITTLSLFFVALLGCGNDEVRKYSAPSPNEPPPPHTHQNNPQPAETEKQARPAGFTWQAPSSWKVSEGSSMRMASYAVPAGEEEGDFSLIQLGGHGGHLEANINRWRGQIGLAHESAENIKSALDAVKAPLGEILICKLVNPESSKAILGGLIFKDSYALFAKLTISSQNVDLVKKDFYDFCATLSAK